MKRASAREYRVHRFLVRAAPWLVAPLLRATPAGGGAWRLELANLSRAGYAPLAALAGEAARAGYRAAAAAAARLHAVALARPGEVAALDLARRTVDADGVLAALDRLPATLDVARAVPGVDLPDALAARLPRLADRLREAAPPPASALTLAHGDLHSGNVMRRPDGDVRLVDWGEACLAPTAWDLAFFDAAGIARYLEARAATSMPVTDVDAFGETLRWAAARRALTLLDAAVVSAFGGLPGASAAVVLCLERVVQAVDAPSTTRGPATPATRPADPAG